MLEIFASMGIDAFSLFTTQDCPNRIDTDGHFKFQEQKKRHVTAQVHLIQVIGSCSVESVFLKPSTTPCAKF